MKKELEYVNELIDQKEEIIRSNPKDLQQPIRERLELLNNIKDYITQKELKQ